jgi:hypothetical protein
MTPSRLEKSDAKERIGQEAWNDFGEMDQIEYPAERSPNQACKKSEHEAVSERVCPLLPVVIRTVAADPAFSIELRHVLSPS